MSVTKIRLQNFRLHTKLDLQISDNLTIITGPNGSGKTSIIEAIYLAYVGKSWRSNFEEIIRRNNQDNQQWWRIDIENEVDQRVVKYTKSSKQKQFIVNQKTYSRLPQSSHRPVILFEPNDMQLLYGSPGRRRQFIDRYISQLEPGYKTTLSKFERVLKQRNNLLKSGQYSLDEMMIWNIQFAALSNKITSLRSQYLRNMNNMFSDKYFEITNDNRPLEINFIKGAPLNSDKILKELINSNELITNIGAQKDDYKFSLSGHNAKVTASRGEGRSMIFAFLATIIELARNKYGQQVITLLDDIDSELDANHRKNLYNLPVFQTNTIATTLEFWGDDNQNNINLTNI